MSLASRYIDLADIAFGVEKGQEESFVHDPSETRVARGDMLLDEDDDASIKSVLPGVDDAKWTQFLRGMITAPLSSVSASNALGLFEMMPRRLADLGIVRRLARAKSPQGRTVWTAVFVAPLTPEKFLKSPQLQYGVFGRSMRDYSDKIADGTIEKPEEMSLSGALAILHRCGPSGIKTWEHGERFPATIAAYERVAGVF